MNKIGSNSIKVMLGAVLALDLIVAAAILGDSPVLLKSVASDQPCLTVFVLEQLVASLLVFGSIISALLCLLSRKKWLVTSGMAISFLAAAYSGHLAFSLSTNGFISTATIYLALSIGAVLLSNLSLHSLSNHQQDEAALMKPLGFTLVLILLISAIWLSDESLDPNFHRYYSNSHKKIADSENAAIGIAGLDAPAGSNFINAGLPAFRNAQIDISKMLNKSKATPALSEPANEITFVGSVEELHCWTGLPDASDVSPKCASEKRLDEILQDNTVLLSRYWQVARIPHVQGIFPNGDLFLKLNRLIAAEVQLKLRHGRYEEAYQEWHENERFINRMIGEDADWIAKAIFTVADSFNLASAEAMIHSSKSIIAVHGDELITTFEPSGFDRWNLPGTLRAEYDVWSQILVTYEPQFWFHPNFIRNSWLHSSLTYLDTAALAPNLANTEMQGILLGSGGFNSWSNDYLKDPLNAVLAHGFLITPLAERKFELLRSFHIQDAKRKALILAIHIKRNGLTDNEIDDYLTSVEPKLRNPFTDKPMTWDARKRAVVFVVPKTCHSCEDSNIETRL